MLDAQHYRVMITAEGWKVQEQITPYFVNVAASKNTTEGPRMEAVVIGMPVYPGSRTDLQRRLAAMEILYAKVRS